MTDTEPEEPEELEVSEELAKELHAMEGDNFGSDRKPS